MAPTGPERSEWMGWVGYALLAAASLGVWGMLSKLALRHASWDQAVLMFGVASVAIMGVIVLARGENWTSEGLWLSVLTGVVGVVAFIVYYLAVGKGQASSVIPVIGVYPAITALLSVVFLGERMSALQVAGVLLAVGGVLLIGLGGR